MIFGLLISLVVLVAIFLVAVLIAKRLNVSKGSIPLLVNKRKLSTSEIPDLSGKVFLITGANAGLGFSSTKLLVGAGATCVMCCRSLEKARAAKKAIAKQLESTPKFKEDNMIEMLLDLASLVSIKDFAEDFMATFDRLDCLMLNAGIMATPYGLTADGIEQQFGVNHVGHFYLTRLLLPLLKKSQPCTVVSVSSAAHFFCPKQGVMGSLEAINEKRTYNKEVHYGQSKLANILFTKELAEKCKSEGLEIYANAIHPGVVVTELVRYYPKFIRSLIEYVDEKFPDKILFSSDSAALTQIYAAIAPVILETPFSGKYLVPLGEESGVHKQGKNKKLQKQLWEMTEDILQKRGHSLEF